MQSLRSLCGTIFPILSLVFALSPVGHAAVTNRITPASTEARTPLQNAVSPRARSSVDLGVAPDSLKLNGLMMQFNKTAIQQAALNQLMADQQNPASPRYHQWLTPQQFGAQFGLSADDIARVTSWLTSQGFTVTGVAKSSTYVTFSGTAAQVRQAFGTTIHTLSHNGESHIANLTDPVLPSAIASVVSNISGLNDFHPTPHLRINQVPASAIRPHFTAPSDSTYHALAPADFNTIYDVNPLISGGFKGDGIGQCASTTKPFCADIAVVGQVDISSGASDIASFRSAAGLDITNLPNQLTVGPNPGTPTGSCATPSAPPSCHPALSDLDESILDLEWAGAIAPNAKLLFVTSTDVIDTSLVATIDYDIAPIISVSYGACEAAFSPSQLSNLNGFLQQATVQGITVIGPTGDDGATDCDNDVSSATQGLAVDFPGSSPYVTGLGGTMFMGDEPPNASAYWNPTNGANSSSAIKYIPETVWNETALDITQPPATFGAGGGGASKYFTKPAWQTGVGVPSDGQRDVPDVSLAAASHHDGYLVCLQGSCNGGQFYDTTTPNGNGYTFGGTSLASPAFAGVMALVEEKLNLGWLGNINPNIYAMANGDMYNNIFHDIINGDNKSPCTLGTTDCPTGGSIGFTASTGYDQASGWGSIDATVFANEWTSFPPPAPAGTIASHTVVTATPDTVAAGTPISLAITVTSGNYTPTGTVQILLDDVIIATSVPLSSGSVSGTLNTTNLTVSLHTIKVIYSGDSNFSGSEGTTTITITGATGTPVGTNTTVIPTPQSTTAGTPVSLAITVAPSSTSANSPAGTVQIQVDGVTVASSVAVASGHAGYTLNTATLAAGNHTITVIYSGDTNFTGSQGTATLQITGSGTGPGGTIASVTSVIPTPNSVAAGSPISLAITVAPGSTSANTPTGTVQIQVDGTTVATSVAVASGHASYTLNTSGLSGGTHTVTVIYSGDTNFNGSNGSTNITISVPATGSDFTITPSTASVSTIVGEKVPAIVLTVTPVNGFTGAITLSTSDTSKDELTPAFSVNPVVINSTNGATTTLTFTSFTSLAKVRGDGQIFHSGSNRSPIGKTRWYVAGSGATLACMFLLFLPRRRRWGALLAVLLSVGAIGASGCGSGGTLPTSATYNITITATAAGNLSHTSTVNVTFKIR
jgi:subtilase family serine protease